MDYSLLVGVHDLKRSEKVDRTRSLSMVYLPKTEEEGFTPASGFNGDSDSDWSSGSELEEFKQYVLFFPSHSHTHTHTHSLTLVLSYRYHVTNFTRDQGGYQSTDQNNNPCNEIYFMGIIDILQPYNLRKIAEHSFKSLRYEGVKLFIILFISMIFIYFYFYL